jgi:two-component system OmpR family response regulator
MTRPADGIAEEPQVSGLSSRPRGVLVIDDTEAVRGFLGAALEGAGFAVWLAPSGREGAALYLAHRAAIDVVLLDVRMPVWDGPATLAALRTLDPEVTCCFMSGDTGQYTQEQLLDLGAAALVQKPFRLVDLLGRLAPLAAPIGTRDGSHEERWG